VFVIGNFGVIDDVFVKHRDTAGMPVGVRFLGFVGGDLGGGFVTLSSGRHENDRRQQI
jgi:hypothetical protein